MKAKVADKDQWLTESLIWGHGSLAARITVSGERLFYYNYYSESKKRVKLPIGVYGNGEAGTMTLTMARSRGMELAALHKSGVRNVKEHLEQQVALEQIAQQAELAKHQAELAQAEARMTVQELFDHWVRVDISNRKDGGAEVCRAFERDVLPLLGEIAVLEIKKGHITQVTDQMLARKVPRAAKVVFSLMRQMFRFAVSRDIIEYDPTANIRKVDIGGKTVERDRVLDDAEIQLLHQKLPGSNLLLTSQYAIWICLSTCCRIGELVTAKWEHIDFVKKQWLIPAENSKNQRMHLISLSNFSLKWFLALWNLTGDSGYCYPNRAGDNHGCTKTITKQIGDRQRDSDSKVYKNRSKHAQALILPHGRWTPHDLRRTGATAMTALGVLPEVAERCLNHTEENRVKRTYQRYSYQSEMTEAWCKLGTYLEQLLAS